MKRFRLVAIPLAVSVAFAAHANETTQAVKITKITNWIGTTNNPDESLTIRTNESSSINPASCSKTDGYDLPAASAVSRALLMTALTTQMDVYLTIYGGGCAPDNRPSIVGVGVEN